MVRSRRIVLPLALLLALHADWCARPAEASVADLASGKKPRWTDNVVPYDVDGDVSHCPVNQDDCKKCSGECDRDPLCKLNCEKCTNIPNAEVTGKIEIGLAEYELKTSLRFRPKTATDTRWVHYQHSYCSGSSHNEKSPDHDGPNVLFTTFNARTVVHETGHAIRLEHEQNHPDRNQFVHFNETCDSSSTSDGLEPFERLPWSEVRVLAPYDVDSVMQYPSFSKSKDSDCSDSVPIAGTTYQSCCPTLMLKLPEPEPASPFASGGKVFKGAEIGLSPGLSAEDVNTIQQMYPPKLGQSETGDHFGQALAAGDFDGDGYTDLAVGAPQEAPGDGPASGAVFLFKGTYTGLVPWKVVKESAVTTPDADDRFGEALAAADFNGDGKSELIVGAPGKNVPPPSGQVPVSAGAVFVFMGSATGPAAQDGYFIHQQSHAAFNASNQKDDVFGSALVAADLDGDGDEDLAVGAYGKHLGGRVYVLAWDKARAAGDKFVKFDAVGHLRESGDRFGYALASADVNGDGVADLAVGSPETTHAGRSGAVYVFLGGASGVGAPDTVRLPDGVPRSEGDEFGAAIGFGNFDGGPRSEMVVGAPGKRNGQGRVFILKLKYAGRTFQAISASKTLDQGGLSTNGADDRFGQVLALADYDHDGTDDLGVGVPRKDVLVTVGPAIHLEPDAGAVELFRGSGTSTGTNAFVSPWLLYVEPSSYGAPESYDRFGAALVGGDFNRRHSDVNHVDLAFGVPGKRAGAGALFVARGRDGDAPILSQAKNPTEADELPDPGFWTHFDQESTDPR